MYDEIEVPWSRVSKMAVKASIAQGYAVTSVITNGNRNIQDNICKS